MEYHEIYTDRVVFPLSQITLRAQKPVVPRKNSFNTNIHSNLLAWNHFVYVLLNVGMLKMNLIHEFYSINYCQITLLSKRLRNSNIDVAKTLISHCSQNVANSSVISSTPQKPPEIGQEL